METAHFLSTVPLLSGLDAAEIERFAELTRERSYPKGSVIVFEDDPGDSLFIVDHSEISGPTKERARSILDLHIEDIDEQHERLKAAGVKFGREKGVEWWGGVISTFNDPDGNTIQLIQFKPELAREEDQ